MEGEKRKGPFVHLTHPIYELAHVSGDDGRL